MLINLTHKGLIIIFDNFFVFHMDFFDNWKQKGKLDKDFVAEATKQVSKSLEAIKKAESAKKKK